MMVIDYMILADAAAVADGKHYIHGAGWDTIAALAFPAVHQALNVAVLLRVPWNETNQEQWLELDVLDADGQSILPAPPGPMRRPITVGRPPQVPAGHDILVPLSFSLLRVPFERPGTYVLTMRVDGVEARRFPFHVVHLRG